MTATPLVTELQRWHDKMTVEVMLIFDYDDQWETIIKLADRQSNDEQAALEAEQVRRQSQQLAGLAEGLNRVPSEVPDWQGASRIAFDNTMNLLSRRIRELAEIGEDSNQLLEAAQKSHKAVDDLFLDLVQDSVKHAERSLSIARSMAAMTNGASLTDWVISNLNQVSRLVGQLKSAVARVEDLSNEVDELMNTLSKDTTRIDSELTQLRERLH